MLSFQATLAPQWQILLRDVDNFAGFEFVGDADAAAAGTVRFLILAGRVTLDLPSICLAIP